MKKLTAISITILALLLALTGCRGNRAVPELQNKQNDGGAHSANIDVEEMGESTSEMRWAAVPAVFVNDTYFRIYADELYQPFPDFDDSWIYLGNIQSAAPGWESPTQNFQTNNEAMIGAEIYHSSAGHIPVTSSVWGDPLDEEIIGDSVIVVFENSRLWYITEEAHSETYKIMGAVERHSLMVDGILYSLMGSAGGGNPVIDDSYTYIGEVVSAVPMDEYPTEHLQANRDFVVGMKVYRPPLGDNHEIIVFLYTNAYYFYKQLPGEIGG